MAAAPRDIRLGAATPGNAAGAQASFVDVWIAASGSKRRLLDTMAEDESSGPPRSEGHVIMHMYAMATLKPLHEPQTKRDVGHVLLSFHRSNTPRPYETRYMQGAQAWAGVMRVPIAHVAPLLRMGAQELCPQDIVRCVPTTTAARLFASTATLLTEGTFGTGEGQKRLARQARCAMERLAMIHETISHTIQRRDVVHVERMDGDASFEPVSNFAKYVAANQALVSLPPPTVPLRTRLTRECSMVAAQCRDLFGTGAKQYFLAVDFVRERDEMYRIPIPDMEAVPTIELRYAFYVFFEEQTLTEWYRDLTDERVARLVSGADFGVITGVSHAAERLKVAALGSSEAEDRERERDVADAEQDDDAEGNAIAPDSRVQGGTCRSSRGAIIVLCAVHEEFFAYGALRRAIARLEMAMAPPLAPGIGVGGPSASGEALPGALDETAAPRSPPAIALAALFPYSPGAASLRRDPVLQWCMRRCSESRMLMSQQQLALAELSESSSNIAVLYGTPGAGKTFTLLNVAACLSDRSAEDTRTPARPRYCEGPALVIFAAPTRTLRDDIGSMATRPQLFPQDRERLLIAVGAGQEDEFSEWLCRRLEEVHAAEVESMRQLERALGGCKTVVLSSLTKQQLAAHHHLTFTVYVKGWATLGDDVFLSLRLVTCTRTMLLKAMARRAPLAKVLRDRDVYVIADEVEDWSETAALAVCGNARGVLFAGDMEQRLVDPSMHESGDMSETLRRYFEPTLKRDRTAHSMLEGCGAAQTRLTVTQRFGDAILEARHALCPSLRRIEQGTDAPPSRGILLKMTRQDEYERSRSTTQHLRRRALPCMGMLLSTALAVAALRKRHRSVCVMCVYRSTAAVVEEFLRGADELVSDRRASSEGAGTLRELVEQGGVKTIRVCRGVTVEAAVLLVHRREFDDREAHGLWATDAAIRNVAMTRASRELVLVADDAVIGNSRTHDGKAMPGLGVAERFFWTRDVPATEIFAGDRPAKEPTARQHDDVTEAGRELLTALGRREPEERQARWWALYERSVRANAEEHPRSMTQRLAEGTQRKQLASAALNALRNRPRRLVVPGEQASDALQTLVDDFNRRAAAQLTQRRARHHDGAGPVPVSAEEGKWILTRGDALLPAVHWTLGASRPHAATKAQHLSHLVSVPFINTAQCDESYPEHFFVTRLACTDEHRLRVAHHKGTIVRTKYAQHFWRECRSTRLAIEVVRHDTEELLAHAYWGMGTRRMLECLSGLVIRTTGCRFPMLLREMFRQHFPQVAVSEGHVYASVDGKDTSPIMLMRQLCGHEPTSDAEMRA